MNYSQTEMNNNAESKMQKYFALNLCLREVRFPHNCVGADFIKSDVLKAED
jgi:hypothetical protein